MNDTQRQAVRDHLTAAGFAPGAKTRDYGDGAYSETWQHDDDMIVVSWGKRPPTRRWRITKNGVPEPGSFASKDAAFGELVRAIGRDQTVQIAQPLADGYRVFRSIDEGVVTYGVAKDAPQDQG